MKSVLISSILISALLLSGCIYLNCKEEPAAPSLSQNFPAILIDTTKQDPPKGQTLNQPYMYDCIRVTRDNLEVSYNKIYDTAADRMPSLRSAAHRDAIQLLPTKAGYWNYQMMGGRMNGVRIIGNQIFSSGQLQGVFASDGSFTNLVIQDNVINSESQHEVTINGLLTGTISGNKNRFGQPARVDLQPMRIGGNIFTGNVWILGFSNQDIGYAPIDRIVRDNALVDDKRTTKTRSYDQNLVDFRYSAFWNFISTMSLASISGDADWSTNFETWMRNLYSKIGVEGVTQERIQKIRRSVLSNADSIIYQIDNTDLLMFSLQQVAMRHGRKI